LYNSILYLIKRFIYIWLHW